MYSVHYQGIPVPLSNHQYHFGGGREYRGKFRGINTSLKPVFGRQRRPDQHSKRVLSRVQKSSAQKIMQSQIQVHETVQETVEEPACQKEGCSEHVIENGPESCSSFEEEQKEEIMVKIENGSPEIGDKNSECNDGTNDNKSVVVEEDAEKIRSNSKSVAIKEKKVKNSPTAKISSKGKHIPKSKKETKSEVKEEGDARNKEKEKLQNEKLESELKSHESAPVPDLQPSIQPIDSICPLTETSEVSDSVVEISHQEQNKSHESASSAGAEASSSKPLDTFSTQDSPRRSTRLATHVSSQKQRSPVKPDSCSIIVLDSDDSISVLEVSRKSQEKSFAETLRSLSGRPSVRPLSAYRRTSNRASTVGSASIRSNVSSRSWTTTANDSESDSQESKILRPRSGLWGLFRTSSQNAPSQDYATDNDESTNRSLADDSGNDSEATTDSPEAPLSVSFGKRKCQDADLIEEAEQERKRIRGEQEQKNIANMSAGLLSIMSSPMNFFKIRGEKGKSSTPIQMLKASNMDEGTRDNLSVHQDDVSEIQDDDENPNNSEKGNVGAISSKMDEKQEEAPRRWCVIM